MFISMCQEFCAWGVSASVHAGMYHPQADPPKSRHPTRADPLKSRPSQEQTPHKSRPPQEQTPQEQTPPEQTLKSRHPPRADNPPPKSRHPQSRHPHTHTHRSTSGRYASYWNAFLVIYTGRWFHHFLREFAGLLN